MRLLVAVDHRQGGLDALELARVLGSGEDSSALVVTVLYTGPYPMEFALLPAEEAEEADPLFDLARARLEGFELETRAFGGGSPAGIIDDILSREEFDAVVVGSPHRGTVGRVLIGSVAASLLNGSRVPVAVAPVDYAKAAADHDRLRTVAVAFDGSPESRLALTRAEEIARREGARLELLTVVQPPAAVPAMTPVYKPQIPAFPERVIEEGVGAVDPALAVEGVRLDGDPASELVKRCREGVDLLVLGSRGYGPVARVLLGSVSRKVASEAPCPVLVVPRG